MKNSGQESVEELLDRAYASEDAEEVAELAERILALEPDNPEGLLLYADITDDDEERLAILSDTAENVRGALKEMGVAEEDFEDNDLGLVYLGVLKRLALTLFSTGDTQGALGAVEELKRHDLDEWDDGEVTVQDLYYRLLVEQGEWRRILEETLRDEDHQLGWAYARLFAAFELNAPAPRMFWDALIMSPNVPFYMLGYREEPDEDGDEWQDFQFALLFSDAMGHDLLNWFSRGTLLFGLLSGRFEGEERDCALKVLESLGGREDYDRVLPLIQAADDATIIETLAAHHCLEI